MKQIMPMHNDVHWLFLYEKLHDKVEKLHDAFFVLKNHYNKFVSL